MRMNKGMPFAHIEADSKDVPTFSEAFLYDTVGKGDARFILGVAEEYEHVIEALGPTAVRSILNVRPKLVNRLGTGEKITEWLADAQDPSNQYREEDSPSQIIVDEDAATEMWQILHHEYERYFEPEKDWDKNLLRLYKLLTDRLGKWTQDRKKAVDEKRAADPDAKARRKEQIAAQKEKRRREYKAQEDLLAALKGEGDKEAALKTFQEVFDGE